ncbi:MAG: hypothetical protein EPN22_12510 [Nitrospirae bacterium]|nr:MAG: hypothetical protein EPN22_12510 [Nitrospirota bacterium]
MTKLSGRLGYTLCERINVLGKIDVFLLAVNLKGYQLVVSDKAALKKVRQRILDAVLFSQDHLNAMVIGLGALTASATDGGKWLATQNGIHSSITHGDTYASLIAAKGIKEISRTSTVSRPTVGIVGAYGIIGSALCRELSADYELIMMGRNNTRLQRLLESVNGNGRITTQLTDMKNADIVVTATSHPTALLTPECLKQGAIVYDVAQPANSCMELLTARPDVERIDGSLVNIPGIKINFDMRNSRGSTFACLGETMIMGLERINGHHVGDVDIEHMRRLQPLGHKYGFTHAEFTSFGKPLNLRGAKDGG